MSAIFFLIGCSVFVALIFLGAFFWANRTGQHDDTYTPSVRILFDDELQEHHVKSQTIEQSVDDALAEAGVTEHELRAK